MASNNSSMSVLLSKIKDLFSLQHTHEPVGTYLYLNCVEHVTKLLYSLMLAVNSKSADAQASIVVRSGLGLGGLLEELRTLSSLALKERGEDSLVKAVLSWVDGCYRSDGKNLSLKASRDTFAHGSVPSMERFQYIKKLAMRCLDTLIDNLSRVVLMDSISGVSRENICMLVPERNGVGYTVELYPFLLLRNDQLFCISRIERPLGLVTYTNGMVDSMFDLDVLPQILKIYPKTPRRVEMEKTWAEIIQEIKPFAETGYPIDCLEDEGVATIRWVRLRSETPEERSDQFSVRSDVGGRAWRTGPQDDWKPYVEFLKFVVVWDRFAKRLKDILDDVIVKRYELEFEDAHGDVTGELRTHYVEPKIEFNSTLLTATREYGDGRVIESGHLMETIDAAAATQGVSTTVFFLHADAGAGKTELMVRMAHQRAQEVSGNPRSRLPLYLFVSSGGSILANLTTIVEATLNSTRLLNADGARVLCRNGLLVLMVDGFDELVSHGKFEDSLDSLSPWLRELKSRGAIVASARSSWYLMQYREHINKERDLSLEHRLLTLSPWSEQDVKSYLGHFGIRNPISKTEYEILKIPFFSKAYIAAQGPVGKNDGTGVVRVRGGQKHHPTFEKVFMTIVDFFLKREEKKLIRPVSNSPLLKFEEIKRIFSEVAGYMHDADVPAIELNDFVDCALVALELPRLDDRIPGLRHRLSSLCGVQVSGGFGDRLPRFEFSHEVLFVCFLTTHIVTFLHNMQQGKIVLIELFKRKSLPRPVFGWLVALQPLQASMLLRELMIEAAREAGEHSNLAFARNTGSLWSARMEQTGGRLEDGVLRGLVIGRAAFRGDYRNDERFLRIDSCDFAELDLSDISGVRVEVINSSIDVLTCSSGEQLRGVVARLNGCKIRAIKSTSEFVEHERQVLDWLTRFGIVPPQEFSSAGYAVSDAEYYLEKLIRGGVQIYVFDASKETDSDHLKWTKHPSPERWVAFLKCLEDSDLIEYVQFNAAGSPKSRVKFKRTLADIYNKNPADPSILAFWKLLESYG